MHRGRKLKGENSVLKRVRSLAEAAREIASKAAAQQLKLLDTVELAHELGSTILPVSIKFASLYEFLKETVKMSGNYKQGEKCAKLAVLLGVDIPVATALSLCALSALVEHDERYLKKYIHKVIEKDRGLPVVHELCMRIMDSPYIPGVMDDMHACALLNALQDKLLETLDLIQNHRAARKPGLRKARNQLQIGDRRNVRESKLAAVFNVTSTVIPCSVFVVCFC